MSTVKIPPVLRSSTGGEKEVAAEGSSVGEVLRALASQHPDTERQLFGECRFDLACERFIRAGHRVTRMFELGNPVEPGRGETLRQGRRGTAQVSAAL